MTIKKIAFVNSGYFFIAIFVVAMFGFVPSYFPRVSGRNVEFTVYTHIHAVCMSLWLGVLIAQPFLIKQRKFDWHRRLGRVSYVVLPAVLVAAVLMIHDWMNRESDLPEHLRFYVGIKDIIIIGTMYTLAMVYVKRPAYHARLIVASTFQLLEPGLARVLRAFFDPLSALYVTWVLIDIALIYLVIKDRNLKNGKWIFRLALAMTVSVQLFFMSGAHDASWFCSLAEWFKMLSLT